MLSGCSVRFFAISIWLYSLKDVFVVGLSRLILEQVPEEAVIKASKVIAVLRNWAASVCGA